MGGDDGGRTEENEGWCGGRLEGKMCWGDVGRSWSVLMASFFSKTFTCSLRRGKGVNTALNPEAVHRLGARYVLQAYSNRHML